jgi:prepilin-type N-terminal cleavage/methylation domain-containing protein
VHQGRRCPTRKSQHGFTLVELMTVVVITGILATLAFGALSGQVRAARGAEALNMVQSIRGAEERYCSEHMMYLDVSTAGVWYPVDPSAGTNRDFERAFYDGGVHTDSARWLLLRPTAPGAVRFGYLVNAGTTGGTMTAPTSPGPTITWPTPTDNWYVIQAIGDADRDGSLSYYRASSLDGEVFSVNHGE